MSRSIVFTVLATALLASAAAMAQAPAGATGACKDGSYTTASSKKGACRGHKGVQEWYASAEAGSAAASAPAATGGKKKRGSRGAAADAAPAIAPTASAGKSNAAPAAPAGSVPAGATGLCKDGSYYTGVTKKGACRGHKGVKDWYAAATPAAAAPAPAAAAPAARTPAAPASAPPAGTTKAGYGPAAAAAAGGGSGLVWVNKDSKVYHCQGDRWYGTTKQGAYMSEANARVQGYRPDHGKACQN